MREEILLPAVIAPLILGREHEGTAANAVKPAADSKLVLEGRGAVINTIPPWENRWTKRLFSLVSLHFKYLEAVS
jgi:hypothetical protein